MKIALCVTPIFHSETAPLGLAYLKANLKKNGHEAKCFDFSKECVMQAENPFGQSTIEKFLQQNYQIVMAWVESIKTYCPDVVGITVWNTTKESSRMLAQELKKQLPHILILAGGPQCIGPELKEILEYADYVIENEGEVAICELLNEYLRDHKISQTKGVWYKKNGVEFFTGVPNRIKNLDSLSFPDFSDFITNDFSQGLPIMFSRGCWAHCVFCPGKKYFDTQISRSGLNVYQEIVHQIKTTHCGKFVFADDSLLSYVTIKELMDFCDRLIENSIRIEWRIYGQRIDYFINETVVEKMMRAGLKHITFGVESFSADVRKDMGKAVSDEVTENNLFSFIKKGACVNLLMIYGYPSESDADFEKTLVWIKKNGSFFHHICFNCFVLNSEYFSRRPGVVKFENDSWHPYRWYSNAVNLKTRKERFLRLIEVLNDLKIEYLISEPYLTKCFRQWDPGSFAALKKEWEML